MNRLPVMRQTWADIVWCHWPVDPAMVQSILPEGLTPDLFEGKAWVGLIPFSMKNLRLPGPFSLLSKLLRVNNFGEVNVRTYVRGPDGKCGVWFCTLDSDDWLAVKTANVAFGLPYRLAKIQLTRNENKIHWVDQRQEDSALSELEVVIKSGDSRPARLGLEQFLVERYALYTSRRGKLFRGELEHHPWRLREGSLLLSRIETVEKAGFHVDAEPYVLVGDPVDVTVYPLHRVG